MQLWLQLSPRTNNDDHRALRGQLLLRNRLDIAEGDVLEPREAISQLGNGQIEAHDAGQSRRDVTIRLEFECAAEPTRTFGRLELSR